MEKNFELQKLRGFAAVGVVLCHSLGLVYLRPNPLSAIAESLGRVSVDVFFVLSGFLMLTKSYSRFNQVGATKNFYVDRIGRVAPLYWVATFAVLAFSSFSKHPISLNFSQILSSLLFIPKDAYPLVAGIHPILYVGWTLNYEMFFYAIFGVFLFLARPWAITGLIGLLGTLSVIGIIFWYSGLSDVGILTDTKHLSTFFCSTILLCFLEGLCIALIMRMPKLKRFACPSPASIGWVAMLVVSILTGLVGTKSLPIRLAEYSVAGVVVLLCTVSTSYRPNSILEKIGDISYSIYLFQFLGLSLGLRLSTALRLSNLVEAMLTFLLALLIGYCAFLAIEHPMLQLTKRLSFSRKTRLIVAGAGNQHNNVL